MVNRDKTVVSANFYKFSLFVFCLLLIGCSSIKIVKCPPNNIPVTILTDVSQIFPVYAPEYKTNFTTTVSLLQSKSVQFGLGGNNKIIELRDKLNQLNITLENELKTTVIFLNQSPCDENSRNELRKVLIKINEDIKQLTILSMKLPFINEKEELIKIAEDSSKALDEIMKDDPKNTSIYFDNKYFYSDNKYFYSSVKEIIDKQLNDVIQKNINKKIEDTEKNLRLEIANIHNSLKINLLAQLLFESGSAEISKDGIHFLENIGNMLKNIKERRIIIIGHTDTSKIHSNLKKIYPSNYELSVDRAKRVARFLIEKANIKSSDISIVGYSEYHPIASNKTEGERLKNRRIEIFLMPEELISILPVSDNNNLK